LILFKAQLEILFDKEIGELGKSVSCFHRAIISTLITRNVKQNLGHVFVIVSVVVHHFQVENTEDADLLVELGIDEPEDVNKEERSGVVAIEFLVIVYLVDYYVHLVLKVASINCLQLDSDFLQRNHQISVIIFVHEALPGEVEDYVEVASPAGRALATD
jgi:hypothetical protein